MKPLDVLLVLVSILFATGVIVDRRWGPERRQHRAVVRFQQAQLDAVESALHGYHERTGRYPSTEEGLEVVPGLRDALLGEPFAAARAFLERFPGVRTIHGIPYVYEHRADWPKGAAKASPARTDNQDNRRWSRRVDDGVYVSSIGLRSDVERVFGKAWLDALVLFTGGVIVFLALGYVVARNRRSGDRVRGINAMIMVGVAVLFAIMMGLSGSRAARGRDALPERIGAQRPDLLGDYLAVLRSFVAAGVHDEDAYRRTEATLRREFGLLPAAPAGPAPAVPVGG